MDNFQDQVPVDEHRHNEAMKDQLQLDIEVLECPFTWMPDRSSFSHVNSEFSIRKNTPNDDNKGFTKYAKYMRVVYEMSCARNDEVLNKLEEWKHFFMESNNDPFFENNHLALKYVLYGSEAWVLFKKGAYDKVGKLVQVLKQIFLDTDPLKAAIIGLKATFFDKYGSKGHAIALPLAREALALDENERWIYILAKTLRDIRRSELYNITDTREELEEELKLFKKLTDLNRKPKYLIRFGNTLHDFATHLRVKHKLATKQYKCPGRYICEDCKEIEYNCDEGVRYFREALDRSPAKRKTYLRIIRGVHNIPTFIQWRYKDLAEDCVEEILKFTNDDDGGEVYLAVGKYYQYLENTPRFIKEQRRGKKAEKYFTMAAQLGSLNAEKEVIIIKHSNSKEYNPCADILRRMNTYPDRMKKLESFCQIVSYYLMIKDDLVMAVEAMNDVLDEDPNISSMAIKKHKSWFLRMMNENLLEILVNEVVLCLENPENITPDQFATLTTFMTRVEAIEPDQINKIRNSPQPMKIKEIKMGSMDSDGTRGHRDSASSYRERGDSKPTDWHSRNNNQSFNNKRYEDCQNKNNFTNWRDKSKQ